MSATADGRTSEEQSRYFLQAVASGSSDLTDLNVLSVTRTIGESVSDIAERLEEEAAARIAEGINRATYVSFGFPLLLATKATGVVQVSRVDTSQQQTIAAGTQVRVPGTNRLYAVAATATLAIGVAATLVGIVAVAPGTFYNTPIATIAEWVIAPSGATIAVTNPSAVASGTDDETDEQRMARFRRWVVSIHRGTPPAIEYGASQATILDGDGNVVERVLSAQLHDAYAVASCWVWNGETTTAATSPEQAAFDEVGLGASAALVARTQQVVNGYYDPASGAPVEGYKPAGVIVNVKAATRRVQPVNLVVYVAADSSLSLIAESIRYALRQVFARQKIGTPVLRLNDLRQAVGLTRGVVDHVFLNPVADIPGGEGVVIVPGAIGLAQG